ncbi:DNA polymerase III subunit delta [Chachezhania antarctica]|uniref:DNA polymerase III subunit delta n=1 Tax=Chachezhania antarctica TaxID=2340860 RepID=UPI000EABA209|nr:DNA polymerase III subunit delta [Chachezhania antarctica]|tara:strand:+ start:6802 stop:7833 length:1032 start_codon:yes stop_codon:yes gene_type:complete
MKLSARDVDSYCARPDKAKAGLLIYGADGMRIALKRQQVLAALLGPGAEEEMRLTRLSGADLRKDPAALLDGLKATGFFPGLRAIFVEEAGDAIAPAVETALDDWTPDDARLIITAGTLKATSKLRKLFESHPNVLTAAIYDDPPSRAEIERILTAAGVQSVPNDALALLETLAAEIGPGAFAQVSEKLALYKHGDVTPVSPDDIDACAPQTSDAVLDDLFNVVADAKVAEIGPILSRLQAQGTQPVGLCIGATRHFRTLYTVASDPGGPRSGVQRLRPPVFGPRRDRITRQASDWGAPKLETALTVLTETDLALRSAGATAPAMALVERALIRLAMLGQRRV